MNPIIAAITQHIEGGNQTTNFLSDQRSRERPDGILVPLRNGRRICHNIESANHNQFSDRSKQRVTGETRRLTRVNAPSNRERIQMVDFNEQPDFMRIATDLGRQLTDELKLQRPKIMGMNALSEHEADIAIANALMMAAAVVFESTYQLPKDSIALEFSEVVRRVVTD
jgi:hypothetical protein